MKYKKKIDLNTLNMELLKTKKELREHREEEKEIKKKQNLEKENNNNKRIGFPSFIVKSIELAVVHHINLCFADSPQCLPSFIVKSIELACCPPDCFPSFIVKSIELAGGPPYCS
ncbi:hypothetical protein ACTFIZ_002934 [Dictyostelium cf. discoideum]